MDKQGSTPEQMARRLLYRDAPVGITCDQLARVSGLETKKRRFLVRGRRYEEANAGNWFK
jgi:hypothetical protein